MRLPVRGQPLHTRHLTLEMRCGGDGLVHVWGEVIDLRKASFVPMVDELQTAGIIHHMTLDARVHPETRVLESLETDQRAVVVEPSEMTRGECCRDPASNLQSLVGRTFDAEFKAELGRAFGGPRGCSHLLTLFHLAVSALPLAFDFEEQQRAKSGVERRPGELLFRRAVFVDGFCPDDGELQLAISLMDYHSAPVAGAEDRYALLARQHEVRVLAEIAVADVSFTSIHAAERERSAATLTEAGWEDRGAWLADLVGRPVIPGLGKELRRRFEARPEAAYGFLDACLQLAPGFVQCTPALADRIFDPLVASAAKGKLSKVPHFLTRGGGANSCYMWREEGPLVQVWIRSDT